MAGKGDFGWSFFGEREEERERESERERREREREMADLI